MPIRIYIDQGHNPESPNSGAEGNGYREQDLVYTIGVALFERLSTDPNFEPRLSRPTPETSLGSSNASSLRVRVNAANAWPADLFLSLHTNASVDASATGTESLVYRLNSKSAEIGTVISRNIAQRTGLRNRGVKARPGLYVLRRTNMPAVLVELGFITNPADAALMASSPNLFADAIYSALRTYYGV